jgi:hypothetical protein
MRRGARDWRYEAAKPMIAGVTTTEGDLIFTGEMTGDLPALDARSGEVLLRRDLGGPAGGRSQFSLATAVSFHSNFADQNQMIHFLKNVMMAGGLLQIVAFGAGALSIDNRNAKVALQGPTIRSS